MESITLYNSSVRLMVRNNSTEDQYTKELQMRDQDVKTCTTRIRKKFERILSCLKCNAIVKDICNIVAYYYDHFSCIPTKKVHAL